jgi:hypothetical protein
VVAVRTPKIRHHDAIQQWASSLPDRAGGGERTLAAIDATTLDTLRTGAGSSGRRFSVPLPDADGSRQGVHYVRAFVLILGLLLGACTPFPGVPTVGPPDSGDAGTDGDSGTADMPDTPDGDGFGCVTEGGCDDGRFCNGLEICLPGAHGADHRGCIPGPAPAVDDGIPCTVDGCDERSGTVLHDPSDCPCVEPGRTCDCTGQAQCPEPLGSCWHFVCSEALVCEQVVKPASSDCDDGASCTLTDKCDGQGVCAGAAADAACNNGSWCDGVETCTPHHDQASPSGCAPGQAPVEADALPCTRAVCLECEPTDRDCEPGLGGAFVHEPTETCECRSDGDCPSTAPCNTGRCDVETYSCGTVRSDAGSGCDDGDACTEDTICDANGGCGEGTSVCGECVDDADCPAPACQRGVCADGVCTSRPVNGVDCATVCPGVQSGTCWDGACTLPPEGPVGTADCTDGEDNNCDGFTDADDDGCQVPDRVLTAGVDSAQAGLQAPGANLVVAHLAQATLLPAQRSNTYCVAHRLHYEQEFDLPDSLAQDPNIGVRAEPITLQSGAAAADGSVGLRMCTGSIVDVGPMTLPPVGNPGDTFLVEIEVATDTQVPLFEGDRLLVGWRSDLLEDGKYVLAVASGPTFGIAGSGRFRFLVDNITGMNSITVRLAVAAPDQTRCSVIDAVRIFQLPHLTQVGADPAARTYLNWRYGDLMEPAYQPFEDVDLDLFLGISPEGATTHLEGDGVLYGATGLEFEALEGETRAALSLPPFDDHPDNVLRANPLVLDFALGSDDANFADGEVMHVFVADAQGQLQLLASSVPDDLDWIVHPMDLPHPAAPAHRATVLVPEALKVREGWRMVLAAFPDDHRTDNLVDEVHAYWFNHPATRDVTIEYRPPQPPSSTAIPIRVRSDAPGRVLLRCYWQVPDGQSFPTVESDSHEVVFE